jgi:trans-aconitate 2-methyltransferase
MSGGTELPGGYAQAAFAARPGTTEAFLAAVIARLLQRQGVRILDLGCGTGDVSIALAARRLDAHVVGLDISDANIALAHTRMTPDIRARLDFIAADYRRWQADAPFDAIVSDSVLHLIPGDDTALVRKLSSDLSSGGLVIATMPDACRRNAALMMQRRLWRATPRSLDRVALRLARRVHRDESPEVLADRIGYLRMLPERLHGAAFAQAMRDAGLAQIEAAPWPGASILKLRHRLFVWRKR